MSIKKLMKAHGYVYNLLGSMWLARGKLVMTRILCEQPHSPTLSHIEIKRAEQPVL